MFDIDRYLNSLKIKEFSPQDELVERTKEQCIKAGKRLRRRPERKGQIKKAAYIALPAAAILLIGVVLGAFLFGAKDTAQPSVVAYYTVDINPSVCINVDEDEVVASIKYQNKDAKALLAGMDIVGLPAIDAIRKIIGAAEAAGYLEGNEKYVLVGRFGSGGDDELDDLQAQLEESLGDMINLLVISGSLEDKQAADASDVSAGLLKLSKMAKGVKLTGQEKVEDVVEEVLENNQDQFIAPTLTTTTGKGGIRLSWNNLNFEDMGYIGDVTYKIVAGSSEDQINSGGGHKIVQYDFDATDDQPQSCIVEAFSHNINPGDVKYFGIYAIYGGLVMKSNVVTVVMPEPSPSPSVEPSKSPEPTPTVTPKPADPMPTPIINTHTVSGHVSGEYVRLSWSKATEDNFKGYKIVASRNNPNPKYPDDGYIKYITNRNTTAKSLYEGYAGLKANTYYYFSVTYLHSDCMEIAGNAVRLKVPEKSEDPEPTPTPNDDMVSTNISGSLGETKVNLSWSAVSHSQFKYYKVVAAKHPNPSYPAESYIDVITNSSTVSGSYKISDFDAGETYYFAITVVYKDGTKMTGSDIALTMPGETPPEEPYVETAIRGNISDNIVSVNWDQINHDQLDGYKVMFSFTDSNPVYGDGSSYRWITNHTTTSTSIDITTIRDYQPGATCYFSITALYNDHDVKKPGNVISFTAPSAEPSPSPSTTDQPDGGDTESGDSD